MIESMIVLVFGLLLAVGYLWLVAGNVRDVYGRDLFNPVAYNLALYIFTGLVGAFAIAIAPRELQINEMVDVWATTELRLFGLALMLYGTVIFAVAMVVLKSPMSAQLQVHDAEEEPLNAVLTNALTAGFLALIAVFSGSRVSALLQVFSSGLDGFGVLALRAEINESEMQGYFIRRLVIDGLAWIFVLYMARLKSYRVQFLILAGAMSFFFLASLAKIKLVLFLLSIFIVRSWDRKLSIGRLVKVIALVFLSLIAIWALFVRNLDPTYLFSIYSEGLIGRIFISEISALYPHLNIFGDESAHLGVSSLSNLVASILGVDLSPRSGRIVLETVSPGWVQAGIGGVFNTVFFGEAYANFGYAGLALAPLVVVTFYVLLMRLARALPSRLRIAFLAHAALNTSCMAGFNDFLYNPFLIILFGVLWLGYHSRVQHIYWR
jgi:hypothetical protein